MRTGKRSGHAHSLHVAHSDTGPGRRENIDAIEVQEAEGRRHILGMLSTKQALPHYECQAEDDLTGPVTAWTCEQIKQEAYNVFMIGFGTPPETLDAGFVQDLWVYIDVDSPTGQQVVEVLWNKATVDISTMTPDQAWDHYEQYTECRLAQ